MRRPIELVGAALLSVIAVFGVALVVAPGADAAAGDGFIHAVRRRDHHQHRRVASTSPSGSTTRSPTAATASTGSSRTATR